MFNYFTKEKNKNAYYIYSMDMPGKEYEEVQNLFNPTPFPNVNN